MPLPPAQFALVYSYFPDLDEQQRGQLSELLPLYQSWNQRINVISRRDLDNFYERHVLHSLAIARVVSFLPESRVLDVGTGGGFPGIPLAIMFPQTQFRLVDSIGKKIRVVQEVADALGLENVVATQQRAEKVKGSFDFIVTRAVARLGLLHAWTRKKLLPVSRHELPNGLICLKGGDLTDELAEAGVPYRQYALSDYFAEEFFTTKQVVYVPAVK
ncbi:MAG: 16S rRNA (guanine(527)-N(7))-methyltransferase RsmG [Tunicatimonas sp.]